MADILKPKSDISMEDMCRPAWLSAAALANDEELDPTLSKFMSIRACSKEEEQRDPAILHGEEDDRLNGLFAFTRMLSSTIHDISYTEQLIARFPYSPSPDNPCDWEGVGFTYASPSLYSLATKKDNNNRIRVVVELEDEVDVYVDQWAYGPLALMSNIFGLVGFYLGYSLIDVVTLLESGYLWSMGYRRREDKNQVSSRVLRGDNGVIQLVLLTCLFHRTPIISTPENKPVSQEMHVRRYHFEPRLEIFVF